MFLMVTKLVIIELSDTMQNYAIAEKESNTYQHAYIAPVTG